MKKIPLAMKTWKSGIAALGALAGLALAPGPAHAQPCADVTTIANDLLSLYLDQFEGDFPLSVQKNCDSLQKTFLSACSSAVKDSAKCWNRQLSMLPKAAGPVCSEQMKPDQCNSTFKSNAKLGQNAIDSQASAESADCQTKAVQLFSDCFLP